MNQRTSTLLVLSVCAALLLIGLVFSARLTAGINHAARQEATEQSPVPTPPSLSPAKAAPTPAHS